MKNRLLIALLLPIAACSPKVDNKGYVKQSDLSAEIVVGKTSKQEILENFGSPSSQSSFGSETWYYINNRLETMAFLKPDVVEQDITRIEFDTAGIVSKLENFGSDKITDVKTISRTTPTEGHTMGFIEQTLGNVGRFNKPGSASGSVAPGRQPSSGY
jgi:outer membrane protein assembly factor BamE (lipoprotein component of BamABCDE complex)